MQGLWRGDLNGMIWPAMPRAEEVSQWAVHSGGVFRKWLIQEPGAPKCWAAFLNWLGIDGSERILVSQW